MLHNIQIEMVSKTGCPYCDLAREYVLTRRVPLIETKLDDDTVRRDYLAEMGAKTVPQLFLVDLENGQRHHIGGYGELELSGLPFLD